MNTNQHSPLFQFASKFLKYFLLTLVGFAIAYVMSTSIGALNIAVMLLPIVGYWVCRLAILLLCLIATAIIFESLR